MKSSTFILWLLIIINSQYINGIDYELFEYFNRTDPAAQQLCDFKQQHPIPIGLLTTSSGKPVEIRETISLNSDAFSNQYHIDLLTHANAERIPERVVHAKGTAAFGYFEVTNDVSQYIKSDMFNGIGKITPTVVRFSTVMQNLGGSDLARETKGMAVKFYTQEGNLDFVALNFPVFFIKDPVKFPFFFHALKRNPKTNLFDFSMRWDFFTKNPESIHALLWLFSDYCVPNGYTKMDAFLIHTYEINNKYGDRYFVKFNFRTEQGIENLPSDVAEDISARDPDYYNRKLYDDIENKIYPAWTLEMDVMTFDDIKKIDYNPFEITRLWKKGTYHTITIGRLVLDRNPDNFFRVTEMSAFNPGNLVPGIPGPMDNLFKSRRSSYRDTQVYRLGVNHNRIEVNTPLYWKVYDRDGKPPVKDNMRDAPNYYPNSFNGPVPYVDSSEPKERFTILEVNAVDLEHASYFYNHYLQHDQRERLVNNTVQSLVPVSPELQRRAIRLLTLTDVDLGIHVSEILDEVLQISSTPMPRVLRVSR
ncbi:catalase-like [Nymphalis io]|uniref:catalase-like n=1 Tax=Inachis io TaxID=171585 RepID=UPI00216924D0|nr:catalase-like [Nymphalis io]